MERTHPKDVGDQTTLAVMLALRMAGLAVLVPFGENTRYDLVIDDGHHQNPQTARRPYIGQVDYFAVYCPETESVYLVPIDDLPVKVQAALRVDSARNNQSRYVRLAEDYLIASVAAEARRFGCPL